MSTSRCNVRVIANGAVSVGDRRKNKKTRKKTGTIGDDRVIGMRRSSTATEKKHHYQRHVLGLDIRAPCRRLTSQRRSTVSRSRLTYFSQFPDTRQVPAPRWAATLAEGTPLYSKRESLLYKYNRRVTNAVCVANFHNGYYATSVTLARNLSLVIRENC